MEKIIENAKVFLKYRKIYYDKYNKTYRLSNDWIHPVNENMYLKITVDDFTCYFNLDVIKAPYKKNYYNDDYERIKFYSYLITNKNKYKPGDKVRFKSYALSRYRIPLKNELELWITGYNKRLKIKEITPLRPGCYVGEFYLTDSLKLLLDKKYNLQLMLPKTNIIVASTSLSYEDYELSGNRLEISLKNNRHYYKENNILTIKATDVNGLYIKDGKAEIVVKVMNIDCPYESYLFFPDTLLYLNIDLEKNRPTTVEIPFEIFKKANLSYRVFVKVIRSNNEIIEKSIDANFYYSNYDLVGELIKDSIRFFLTFNGKVLDNIKAEIFYNDDLNHQKVIILPYTEKINPAISNVFIKTDSIKKEIDLKNILPYIDIHGKIENDSFKVELKNPHLLETTWYIYQGSDLLKAGTGKKFKFHTLIEDKTKSFYVSVSYLYAGKTFNLKREYKIQQDRLNIEFDIPERIYPGQEVNAEISVKNLHGEPVKNVDLTALGVDARLNYNFPAIPYFGYSSMSRNQKDSYSLNKKNYYNTIDLDYKKWKKILGLDTMMYYKFIFPDSYFIYQYPIEDSTQFAPFVMENGNALNIYIIEINNQPIYFSWTNHIKRYSFYVPHSKKVQITLRLANMVVRLDSMIFPQNTKTIISCDVNKIKSANKISLPNYFTDYEKQKYSFYITSFSFDKDINWAYLLDEKNNIIPILKRTYEEKGIKNITVGPVYPSYYTYKDNNYSILKYKSECCFISKIQDNIVYRQKDNVNLNFPLVKSYYDPMNVINDFSINQKIFEEMIREKIYYVKWHEDIMHISDNQLNIKVFFPDIIKFIVAILLENNKGKISSFIYRFSYRYYKDFRNLKHDFYNIIILYEDGSYIKKSNVFFDKKGFICLDLRKETLKNKDLYSEALLEKYYKPEGELENFPFINGEKILDKHSFSFIEKEFETYNISGTVLDENDEPLPAAVVHVNNTDIYTVTDFNGKFYLYIPNDNKAQLIVRYLGYEDEVVDVSIGTNVIIKMTPYVFDLLDVIVVGYGKTSMASINNSMIDKNDETITNEYEKDPENITNKNIDDPEEILYIELLTLNKIRSNFQYVAFWEPALITNNKGMSSFTVKFPDNITRWDAVVYGMNRKLQTGSTVKKILSYKPIMAELSIPQFLTLDDSTNIIGKISNYTKDTLIKGKIEFKQNNQQIYADNISFNFNYVKSVGIKANELDTIVINYSFKRDDGYFDGEERKLPVKEKGIIFVDGNLNILKKGDSIEFKNNSGNSYYIEIIENHINILLNDIYYLMSYEHACNEQLASILTSLLSMKIVCSYTGKNFDYDKNVYEIIEKLLKNQNQEFLWSWWGNQANTSYWVSAHILRSLKFAADLGYPVKIDFENIKRKLTYKYFILNSLDIGDIEVLNILANWNIDFEYERYLPRLDSIVNYNEKYYENKSFLYYKFLLEEIKQLRNLDFNVNNILKYKRDFILGSICFDDNKYENNWKSNKLNTNVVAYRILKRDSILKNKLCEKMILFFIKEKNKYAYNTYLISNVMGILIYDLLQYGTYKKYDNLLIIKGKENKNITKFPYKVQLFKDEKIEIVNKSNNFFYVMNYEHRKVTEKHKGTDQMHIETYFKNNNNYLKAGEPIDFVAMVEGESDCEYVVIEIPIPAGCSYIDKNKRNYSFETHREYFKDKTVIYLENLKKGLYYFEIPLLPRFTGKYNINPAKISLMYFPVINANNSLKTVKIY